MPHDLFPNPPRVLSALERRRLVNREGQDRYRANPANAHKIGARRAVQSALRRGELSWPERCRLCGALGRIEAHHADHMKPLEVEWLCHACNRAQDRRTDHMQADLPIAAPPATDWRSWERLTMTGDLADLCERAGGIMAAKLEASGANDCDLRGSGAALVRDAILEALGARRGAIEAVADPGRHDRPGAFLSPAELASALGIPELVADALVRALVDLGVLTFGPPTRFAPWLWWRAVAAMRGELGPC